jgi:hypothetical protein
VTRAAGVLSFLAALALATTALAQATTNSSGGAGALGGDGAGMIGGPAASAGLHGSGVVSLPNNQPQNPALPPPVGAGYGTPGNVGNLGNASNAGVGAGVQSDIHSGIPTTPNTP